MDSERQDEVTPPVLPDADERAREDVLEELDRLAPDLIAAGRPETVAPWLTGLDLRDLDGHPWGSVVAAAALQAPTGGTNQLLDHLLMSAEDEFWREGNERGLGHVAYVRARAAIRRGDFGEAAEWWRQAREYLGEDGGPLSEVALAHLALAAYQDGRVHEAFATAEHALARQRRNRRGEGVSLLYLGFFSMWMGDFARGETLLTTARRVYGEIVDPRQRLEAALVEAGLGVLYAQRSRRASAEAMFDSALRMSQAAGTEWFTGIIRIMRAESCAIWNAPRSTADANLAIDYFSDVMRNDFWLRWARRALAIADLYSGNFDAAAHSFTSLLEQDTNAMERAWILLALAQCRRHAGQLNQARAVLNEALGLAAEAHSRWVQACVARLLTDVDTERREEWRRRAIELMDRDPAYRRLLTSNTPLRIDAFGRGRILVGDKPVKFATRHAEAAVFILALAGDDGVNSETLAERLWPNVASSVWPGRVRTLLWQIRRALGDESWRLERDGPVIRLDLAGARFDVEEARDLASTVLQGYAIPAERHEALVVSLQQPLLTAYQYEEWVTDDAVELQRLSERVACRSDLKF